MDTLCNVAPRALKPAATYEEQLEKLKSRGLIVRDDKEAIRTISRVGYYRFTGYLLHCYDKTTDKYQENITFESISRIYDFDQRLREFLMSLLSQIEIIIRARTTHYHAQKYGPDGYINSSSFMNTERHAEFISSLEDQKKKHKNSLIVKHHIKEYGGILPIWAAAEFFTMGILSKFYANMLIEDRKCIARMYFNTGIDQLQSWLQCISEIRNRCAHYMRIYNNNLFMNVKLDKSFPGKGNINHSETNKIFFHIYYLRFLLQDEVAWRSKYYPSLLAILDEYKDVVDIALLGFSEDRLKLI